MLLRGGGEWLHVVGIRRDDAVSILGQEHESRIDHVVAAGHGKQLACGAAEGIVQRPDIDTR